VVARSRGKGFMMKSRFQITVSSELIAIFVVASDLAEIRQRIAWVAVARTRGGEPVTKTGLQVEGFVVVKRSRNPLVSPAAA
jgi:formyltetrahydrofolate synthetase